MSRVLEFLVCFLLAVSGYLYLSRVNLENKIITLESQKTALDSDLKKCQKEKEVCNERMEAYNNARERADNDISEIRTVVRTVKSPCSCYDSPVDNSIIGRVRGE